MSDYAQDALDADAAFREDGQLITFTSKQTGGYVAGAVVPGTSVVSTAWGIETAVTAHDLGVGSINGTLVQTGDRKVMHSVFDNVGAALPEPKIADLVTLGAKVYTVKNVDSLKPGGVVVMYTLIVRA